MESNLSDDEVEKKDDTELLLGIDVDSGLEDLNTEHMFGKESEATRNLHTKRNVFALGFGFMCVFTAFQTCGFFQPLVLQSLGYKNLGFVSLAVIYSSFSVANFFVPLVISFLGIRNSLVVSALIYTIFVGSLVKVIPWLFIIFSLLLGCAAALIWVSQGVALTLSTQPSTRGFYMGVFWTLNQFSLLNGSMISFLIIPSGKNVSIGTSRHLFAALALISMVGVFLLFLVKVEPLKDTKKNSTIDILKKSFMLLKKKNMILILPITLYLGMSLAFWSARYPNLVSGQEIPLPDYFNPQNVSFLLLSVGLAQVSGGLLFGKLSNIYGTNISLSLGSLCHLLAYMIIMVNFYGIEIPILALAYLAGFLLGLGESCINPQIMTLLGNLFPKSSAPAFAIFNFVKSIVTALCFFIVTYVPLNVFCFLLIGCLIFALGSILFVNQNEEN